MGTYGKKVKQPGFPSATYLKAAQGAFLASLAGALWFVRVCVRACVCVHACSRLPVLAQLPGYLPFDFFKLKYFK